MTEVYTIKYGRDGERLQYTHDRELDLAKAREKADAWLSTNGWGGYPEGELRVWIVDRRGAVVYGREAQR